MSDFANFQEFFTALKGTVDTFHNGTTTAAAGGALMLALRLFRSDFIQNYLPAKLRWANLPWYEKLFLPFLASAGATFLGTLGGGTVAIPAAIAAALATAFSAIVLHHGTEAAGSALTSATEVPSMARQAIAPFLPIDKAKLPAFALNQK